MRKFLLALCGACVVLALVVSSVRADEPAKRPVFEYKALHTGPISPDNYNAEFNKLGKDGWEAVAANEFAIIFKRQQQP